VNASRSWTLKERPDGFQATMCSRWLEAASLRTSCSSHGNMTLFCFDLHAGSVMVVVPVVVVLMEGLLLLLLLTAEERVCLGIMLVMDVVV